MLRDSLDYNHHDGDLRPASTRPEEPSIRHSECQQAVHVLEHQGEDGRQYAALEKDTPRNDRTDAQRHPKAESRTHR